ncbi:hypothetical protein [Rubrivivax sp. A210]|uniref:hypothetical protein n=1 Tax=Rubrivivax sp. A210 TaxID=2772301 RepID=UPI00191B2FDF|nr:hypothetical protein [Rubrivivax sp. A210]
MKSSQALAALGLAVALLGAGIPARAGDGHDHGDTAPVASGPALPRFAAVSETLELVGVLAGKQLTLYLDRLADNAPVRDAQIELEIAGAKFKAQKHGDDVYEVVLADAPKPGVLPITATVTAGNEVDLLAGELDIHEQAHEQEAAHGHSLKEVAAWVTGGLVGLAVLVLGGRRLKASQALRAGAEA